MTVELTIPVVGQEQHLGAIVGAEHRLHVEVAQLERPHVIAGVNVIATDTLAEAQRHLASRRRSFIRAVSSPPGHRLTEAEVDAVLRSPQAAMVEQMFTYTAMGAPATVRAWLEAFAQKTGADELMTVHATEDVESRLRSLELLAAA